jgi:WD repeat-containing protein 68
MSKDDEIYTYEAPWPVYGLHWCQRPGTLRLGISSVLEEFNNKIQVLGLRDGQFHVEAQADHAYPVTKLNWIPQKANQNLLATTGDFLRLWRLENGLEMVATLANMRRSSGKRELCAPLTSFDWNDTDPSMIVTSSIDTTCTVWDIQVPLKKRELTFGRRSRQRHS